MIISQNGAVDLIPEYNRALRPIFCVSEGDANSRTINLTVTSAGEVFNIPEGAEVYVAGKKQDNTIFTYQCAFSGYIVSFPIAEQMSAANGLVLCELQIVVAGDPLGSANFCYWVEPSPIANGSSSESDLNIFEQAIAALGGYEYLTSEVSVLSARMDQFARLPDGSLSTAADAELADVRVKANGTTAATAGDAVREQITELKNDLDLNLGNVIPTDTYEDVNTTFTQNTFWNSEGTVANLTSYTGYYQASAPIEVAENEVYFVGAKAGTSGKQRVICIVDENYNILHKQGYGSNVYYSATITVPQNGKYLLITTVAEDTASVIIRKYNTAKYEASNSEKFKGLSFSVMGDSFSSYTGEIPSGNTPYYTGNNAGVYSPNEMWYSVVGRILGMTTDTINGYSGSLVTSGVRDGITPASDASRCSNLGTNPDIIIIAMGVNDYSYSAPLGEWDGTTNHADDTTTYRTAYATMLKRIKTNYPNALIVCVTPFFTQRGINNGTTYVNGIPLTCYDYVKATRDIAEIMGCCVIDGWNIGFNRHNYYPQYCSDSDTTPTHPNARGHRVIGETIAKELSVVAEGFIRNINANNI